MTKLEKVALCIPTYSYIPSQFLINVLNILNDISGKFELTILEQMDNPLDKARNILVQKALSSGVDYIWFLDTDNMVPKRCLENLINTMKDEKADIVTAIYFSKSKPYYPVLRKLIGENFYKIDHADLNQVIRVDGCGLGCVLIKADVFDKIDFPYFYFEYSKLNGSLKQISEDLYFCKKASKVGLKIVCNTGIVSNHLGSEVSSIEYNGYAHLRKDLEKDRDAYVKDLSEFTETPYEASLAMLFRGTEMIKNEWNEKNPASEKEVTEFYKSTKNYLYDLGGWHFGERRMFDLELVETIKQLKPTKILDFGCGAGINGFLLAREKFDVTLADLESYSLLFAEYRMKKHNLPHKIWNLSKKAEINDKFDVILCFDVLEHLPKNVLFQTIDMLKSVKSENCKVFLTTSFGNSESHPMHYTLDKESKEKIEELI